MRLIYAPIGILFLVLLVFFETIQMKCWVSLLFCLLNAIYFPFFQKKRKHVQRVALVGTGLFLIGGILAFPQRFHSSNELVQSVFFNERHEQVPQPLFPYLVDNLIPEIEKVKFSIAFAPWFPFPTGGVILEEIRQQRLWDNVFLPEYRAVYAKPHAKQASVLLFQGLQQIGRYPKVSHYILYTPEEVKDKVPLIIFLHGYMGQFLFYNSYFSEIAGYAILTPSTPDLRGVWQKADLERIFSVYLPEIEKRTPIDRENIHLIGLSNGGSGVNAAIVHMPERFQSFTFISTIVYEPLPAFERSKPIGIIYGTRDHIAENNRLMEQKLKQAHYRIKVTAFQDEGHLVLLSRKPEVLQAIKDIIETASTRP